jgi:hypothetical protein
VSRININSFNQPLDSWDVSGVTNMEYMFFHTPNFKQRLDSWDVSGVTTIENIFLLGDPHNIETRVFPKFGDPSKGVHHPSNVLRNKMLGDGQPFTWGGGGEGTDFRKIRC